LEFFYAIEIWIKIVYNVIYNLRVVTMSQDFEKLNKQIAAFIVVSSAFAAPVCAGGGLDVGGVAVPSSYQDMVVKYAGPGMVTPEASDPAVMPIDRYAGPGLIPPAPSEPSEPPMMVKYAGPGMPIPKPQTSNAVSRLEQVKRLDNPDSLRVIDSAESVTLKSSEEEHNYGEIKVAPGRFRFW
jgi:hypothetical protein